MANTLLVALRDSNRNSFRVVHYSIQDGHVHIPYEYESVLIKTTSDVKTVVPEGADVGKL